MSQRPNSRAVLRSHSHEGSPEECRPLWAARQAHPRPQCAGPSLPLSLSLSLSRLCTHSGPTTTHEREPAARPVRGRVAKSGTTRDPSVAKSGATRPPSVAKSGTTRAAAWRRALSALAPVARPAMRSGSTVCRRAASTVLCAPIAPRVRPKQRPPSAPVDARVVPVAPLWSPCGPRVVPVWCPCGARVVPVWCPCGLLVVSWWSPVPVVVWA
eukprot:822120-Prymnesium_polylepis.1